jgi:hypothetical protein
MVFGGMLLFIPFMLLAEEELDDKAKETVVGSSPASTIPNSNSKTAWTDIDIKGWPR